MLACALVPSRNQFSVALPAKLRADMKAVAEETGETVAFLVRRCVMRAWPAVRAVVLGHHPSETPESVLLNLETAIENGRADEEKGRRDPAARAVRTARGRRDVPPRNRRRD